MVIKIKSFFPVKNGVFKYYQPIPKKMIFLSLSALTLFALENTPLKILKNSFHQ